MQNSRALSKSEMNQKNEEKQKQIHILWIIADEISVNFADVKKQ